MALRRRGTLAVRRAGGDDAQKPVGQGASWSASIRIANAALAVRSLSNIDHPDSPAAWPSMNNLYSIARNQAVSDLFSRVPSQSVIQQTCLHLQLEEF